MYLIIHESKRQNNHEKDFSSTHIFSTCLINHYWTEKLNLVSDEENVSQHTLVFSPCIKLQFNSHLFV